MFSRLNRFASAATEESRESSWTLFRLLVAAMFLTHGYDKLLGESPQEPVDSGMTNLDIGDLISCPVPLDINLLFAAGVAELAGGVLILIGLWTHLVSLLALTTMTMAYLIAHRAWFPTLNGGEMVALYWAAFLVLFTFGAGPYSADTWLKLRRQENVRKKYREMPDFRRRSQSGFDTE